MSTVAAAHVAPRGGVAIRWEERLNPRRSSPLWGEHRARYRFAAPHALGARVLDAACGNGYGSAMLSAAGAAQVCGIDLAAEAIRFAHTYYLGQARARFLRANAEGLPFRGRSFDLVTCFETIEHVRNPERAVREIDRVLCRVGTLLMSSPNGAVFPGGHSGNPFHFTEFRVDELASLLAPHFNRVGVFGQRLTRSIPGVLANPGIPCAPNTLARTRWATRWRRHAFACLPYTLQDLAWRVFRKEPYYPEEHEFVLESDRPERFPVIVAVCSRG